jgi:hypothetical protein
MLVATGVEVLAEDVLTHGYMNAGTPAEVHTIVLAKRL